MTDGAAKRDGVRARFDARWAMDAQNIRDPGGTMPRVDPMKQPPFAYATDKSDFVFSIRPTLSGALQAARDRFDGYASPLLEITAWFEDGTSTAIPWERLVKNDESGGTQFISDDEADKLVLELFGPRRVSFAEYMNLPDPDERLVLHHGVVKKRPVHTLTEGAIKRRLIETIDHAIGNTGNKSDNGFCWQGMAYQPLPDFELWVAGVALVSNSRRESTPQDGYIQGSPELIIEVIPPKLPPEEEAELVRLAGPLLSMEEIEDEREIALRTGCLQFWLYNHELRTIVVTDSEGTRTAAEGAVITLPTPWSATKIEVSTLFDVEK